ncbi:MAG: hypothetical protein ACF8R7_13475 [Phycisphaerales bacterium JB039]
MTPLPLGLLSLLPAAARSVHGPAPAHSPASADFADLLEQAQQAQFSSGRAVALGPGLDLRLTDEQLQRLATAADRAEAAGATTAAVLLDGHALVLDVGARTITAAVDPAGAEPIVGVDAVIAAPPAQPAAAPRPGATIISNPSLLEALSRPTA